jgi:hypothetical protein
VLFKGCATKRSKLTFNVIVLTRINLPEQHATPQRSHQSGVTMFTAYTGLGIEEGITSFPLKSRTYAEFTDLEPFGYVSVSGYEVCRAGLGRIAT